MDEYILYGIVLIFGILIGSFLNVCIYRIPEELDIVIEPSHCMYCNTRLKWYELVPILSYVFLRGRCRTCKSKVSIQYPIIEALNGIMFVLVFYFYGWDSMYSILLSIIYSLTISALIVLSLIDIKTKNIPVGINIFILIMGLAVTMTKYFEGGKDTDLVIDHIIGFFALSIFLLLLFYASKGRAIGGGDIKLMASAGLLLGWELVILAFIIGCVLAAIIHPLRMRIQNVGRALAFGPYLSAGITITIFYGTQMIEWYVDKVFV